MAALFTHLIAFIIGGTIGALFVAITCATKDANNKAERAAPHGYSESYVTSLRQQLEDARDAMSTLITAYHMLDQKHQDLYKSVHTPEV